MSKILKKIPLCFGILCIIFLLISISLMTTGIYAIADEKLEITSVGETKIISNVQNFLNSQSRTRSNSSYDKVDKILEALNVDNPEDFKVNSAFYENCMNAKTIYATRNTILDSLSYDDGSINISYLIFEDGNSYNNMPTFILYALASWKSGHPSTRLTDTICFAYTGGNVLGTGSSNALYEMYYNQVNYLTGSKTYITKTKEQLHEQNIMPHFGVYYPMPPNTLAPNYFYTDFLLFAQCKVTATDNFIATCAYGHQTFIATPSATISTSGISVGITFSKGVENYCPGQIRIII